MKILRAIFSILGLLLIIFGVLVLKNQIDVNFTTFESLLMIGFGNLMNTTWFNFILGIMVILYAFMVYI